MTDENYIGQILVLDDADHVLNMRVEIDLAAEEVLARADTGQRRSVYFMPRLAQPWRQLPPNHAAGPAAMHQDERRHSFLPSKRGTVSRSKYTTGREGGAVPGDKKPATALVLGSLSIPPITQHDEQIEGGKR